MDPPELTEGEEGGGGVRERRALRILSRCGFSILFSIGASFLFSFLFGLAAIAIGSSSSSLSPVSVAALCRIISSSVDLRSSRVCELGLLNYKAKHVFYPLGKTRFRCRDDYYWASIFEVEYKEFFSGEVVRAVAEVPKEALPHDCRPSFGSAWLTKSKFKVNETYNCRYTLGSLETDIHSDSLFNCEAKIPSTREMMRRTFTLLVTSYSFDKGCSGCKMVYTVAGLVCGMLVSMCLVILLKTLQVSVVSSSRRWHAIKPRIAGFAARFRLACLLVAYFSAMAWLTLQYGKTIGLKQLLRDSHLTDKTITR